MTTIYDTIGIDYAQLRKPDRRIAAMIETALGDARRVLNVGAGTGSYEPAGREVVALEPSAAMISQRPSGAAPAIQGEADSLPFADKSFDAAMAVLTVHHWGQQAQGMAELRRVARNRIVILTHDPEFRGAWLMDYFPELITLDAPIMPTMTAFERWLGPVDIQPVLVPHDCTDGFLYAYWRRPKAYLDPHVRSGSSSFWKMGSADAGLSRLADDLNSGAWDARYGAILDEEVLDVGYRLVVAQISPTENSSA